MDLSSLSAKPATAIKQRGVAWRVRLRISFSPVKASGDAHLQSTTYVQRKEKTVVKIKTNVRADGTQMRRSQTVARSVRVQSRVKGRMPLGDPPTKEPADPGVLNGQRP